MIKTVMTIQGKRVPLIEIIIEDKYSYHKFDQWKVGDEMIIGVYGNDYVKGKIISKGLLGTGTHKFTKDGCETYLANSATFELDNGNTLSVFSGYPYPINKI